MRPGKAGRVRRGLAITLAIPLLLAGAGATALGWDQERTGGYADSDEQRFTTSTVGFKTDEIEVGESTAHPTDPNPDIGELATVRIVVRPSDPRARVFVGIGPKSQVEAFLRGTAYDEFAGARLDPFHATFRRSPGAALPTSPAEQPFWAAASEGTGTRTLEWDKTHGPWSVVVMRTDGVSGLDVQASIGLRFGFLLPLGLTALILGTLLAVGSFLSLRKPRPHPPNPSTPTPAPPHRTTATALAGGRTPR